MQRATCPICKTNPVAINYRRGQRVYYRSLCTPCIHKRRSVPQIASWIKSGYKKSDRCDRCQFRFKMSDQSDVYYIDGNTNNNHWANLRTICRNCQIEVAHTRWRPSNLRPDF